MNSGPGRGPTGPRALRYQKEAPWEGLSNMLIKYYGLPFGSSFALKRKGATVLRSIARRDMKVRRRLLFLHDHPRTPDNHIKVGEICHRIESMLSPHYRAQFSVVAIGPDGKLMPGQTTLKGWRGKPPKLTPQERTAAEIHRREIGTLTDQMHRMLDDLEEGIENPAQKIPQAVIQALREHFTSSDVKEALKELGLV